MEHEEEEGHWRRYAPMGGAFAVIALLGWGLVSFVSSMGGVKAPEPPAIQEISLVAPPPPPPPPKIEEPPPEPEIEEVEVPDEPEPNEELADSADDAPIDDLLGLDADGAAGSDAFGLKAKKGGRSLIGGGSGGNARFAASIERTLQIALNSDERLKGREYRVNVQIFTAQDQAIQDVRIVRGTGNLELDGAIVEAILTSGVRLELPDDNSSVTIALTSRA